MPEKICISTVTSPEFIPGTTVLIHSFLKHNPWFDGDIVIISDGMERGQEALFRFFPKVRFHKPGEDLLLRIGHLCHALPALTPKRKRFYSIEVFSIGDYDRVFFFDSDMLVTANISEVLKISGPLLACSDQPTRFSGRVRDRRSFLRVHPSEHPPSASVLKNTFNAGFMVLDKTIRNQPSYDGLKDLMNVDIFRNIRTHNTDQVVLNLYFDGLASILPFTYNIIVSKWPEFQSIEEIEQADIKILHFTGNYKPWEPDSKMNDLAEDPAFSGFYRAWHASEEELKALE